jgi:branched-chain amino acid transport system substrate-binding protein
VKIRIVLNLLALPLLVWPAAAEMRIGLGAPLSGPDAIFGAELRNGVEQAVADLNAQGGILGSKFAVVPGDDRGDLKQGIAVANDFVADRISFVIGHFHSSITLAASEIYANHAILDITPSATNPQITERGLDLMFRTCGRDDQQSAVAAQFLAAQKNKRVAIIYDNTSEGKALADDVRARLAKGGITDVFYGGIDSGTKDFSKLAGRIKATAADAVYWSGDGADAGALLKEMRAEGISAQFLGSDAISSDEFANAGGGAIEGALMTFPADPRRRPEAATVVQEFKARGIDPEVFTLYAYAAVQVLAEAAQQAGKFDPVALAKVMHAGHSFKTVLGPLAYDAKGDVTTPDYDIFVWKRDDENQLVFDMRSP